MNRVAEKCTIWRSTYEHVFSKPIPSVAPPLVSASATLAHDVYAFYFYLSLLSFCCFLFFFLIFYTPSTLQMSFLCKNGASQWNNINTRRAACDVFSLIRSVYFYLFIYFLRDSGMSKGFSARTGSRRDRTNYTVVRKPFSRA